MADVLSKVKQLLELAATNANIDEARNAALQAARLIKRHGLAIGVRVAESTADAVVEEVDRVVRPRAERPGGGERAEPPQSRTKRAKRRSDVMDATVEAAGRVASKVARDVAKDVARDVWDLFGGRR